MVRCARLMSESAAPAFYDVAFGPHPRNDHAAGRADGVDASQFFRGEDDVELLEVVFELRERARLDDRARDGTFRW